MRMPAVIYGTYKTAQSGVRSALTRFAHGAPWPAALIGAGTVDTAELPGLLLLSGPNPLLSNGDHFHLFLPLTQLSRTISQGRLAPAAEFGVFADSLTTPDGVLGLLAPPNVMWVYPPERQAPFLAAVARFWRALDDQGARYSIGMAVGSPLWDLPSNLKFVLARGGIDTAVLNAPLPPGGIDALIEAAANRPRA
jgi:hypothetical protein